MPNPSPLQVVQITDSHLFADADQEMMGCPTNRTFQAVVQQIQRSPIQPDLLLLTGDLSQDETPASYQQVQDWIAPLNIPTYWIPGNHDTPPLMEQILGTPPFSNQKAFQMQGWNFILLSSALAEHVEGVLSAETLSHLEQHLEATPDRPTLVALHHPPLPIGSAWMDKIGLKQPESLFALLDRYTQVKLVLFGHIHQEFQAQRHGVSYLGTPSTCVQFEARCDQFKIAAQGPSFRRLTLYSDGHYDTQIEWVEFCT